RFDPTRAGDDELRHRGFRRPPYLRTARYSQRTAMSFWPEVSCWKTPEVNLCWVIPGGMTIVLQIPRRSTFRTSRTAFIFVLFLSSLCGAQSGRSQNAHAQVNV